MFVYCFLCLAMAEQKKFSLAKAVAGNKRSESSQQSAAAKKIPKVSEMTPVEARPQKIVTNAPVVVCVYPVFMWHTYMEPSIANQACQICRNCVCSVHVTVKASFGKYHTPGI